jgi:small subunit ribosomal protein S8
MSVMVTDPIADMLTRIRNANQQRHAEVVIPHSRLKVELAEILKNEGFISGYKVEGEGAIKNIVVTLKYKGNERVISGLKRVSKPGLRQYAKVNEIPKVLNGLGIVVLSTSQGLMTDKEARAKQIGGEVLAYIW